MAEHPDPNAEPFTPETLARHTIARFGDEAGLQASLNADHFYEHNQIHIARIWYEAAKIIEATRQIKEAAGGSLNDYILETAGNLGTQKRMADVASRIKNQQLKLLSGNHYELWKAEFDFQRSDGSWQHQTRESYDIGDGAAVLPIDPASGSVLLIRQFRWPAFSHGYRKLLVEVIAGKLDGDTPVGCVVKEAREEAGVEITRLREVFHCFMSPGAVQERLHLFVAEYDSNQTRSNASGNHAEGEDIETLELPLSKALEMTRSGEIIDAKTIMLLQWAALHSLPNGT